MSRNLQLRRALLAVVLLAPLGANAEIYRWHDASGREHFTSDLQQVPAPHRRQALEAPRAGEGSSLNFHAEPPTADSELGAPPAEDSEQDTPAAADSEQETPPANGRETVGYDCEALKKQARKQLSQIAKKERVVDRREDSASNIASSIYADHRLKKTLRKAKLDLAELRADYERWRTLHYRRGAPAGCLR